MENASKALIIAGAILLSILIIALGMFIYQKAAGAMEGISINSQEVQSYNAPFINYEGTQTGSAVRALCDAVRSHNNANQNDVSLQIGITYGNKGKTQDVKKLDKTISYTDVTNVINYIKVVRMYTVTMQTADSGKYANIVITDANSSSSGGSSSSTNN